jgi:universal stress protein E
MKNVPAFSTLRRIIVVVDPDSEQQPAIERLKYFAERASFEVLLVCSGYSEYLLEGYYFSEAELPSLRDEFLAERKEVLELLAAPLRATGLSIDTRSVWSHPAHRGIIEIVDEYRPDMVIHHVDRQAALSRMILNNDDWELARRCPAPLLLVKNKLWKDRPLILAAVDPMHGRHKPDGLDHAIIATGKVLAENLGGEVYVVHAYGQLPLSGIYPADAEKRHKQAFTKLADEFELDEHQRILSPATPEYGLRQLEGELAADLVIVGAVSRSLLADMFIGSTTEKVLDSLECDALLLRPAIVASAN